MIGILQEGINMTTNNFKKAMALSVVPAVSLGLLAIPANAQDKTTSASETAENTINLKISGIDRDREANVQLVNGEDKVIAEKTVKRNGARVSFDYNSEDVVDGILTVAVDGKTYTTIGAKCTAQSDKGKTSEEQEPTTSEEKPSSEAESEAPAPAQPEAPANTAPSADVADTAPAAPADTAPAGDANTAPAGDATGGKSEEKEGLLDKLGGAGDILNKGLALAGGPEGLSKLVNDGINNFLGGNGSIDSGKILDLASEGAGALPQNADENLNEDYIKAIEIAANDKDSKISDKEAKELNLEGTEKETAEGFAELGKVYAEGLEEYAGKNPTDAQINEYNDLFTDVLVEEISTADPYLFERLKKVAGKVLDSPIGDMAIDAGASLADTVAPGIGGLAVKTIGGGLKDKLSDKLQEGDSKEAAGTEVAEGGANAAPAEDTTATDTGADTANTPSTGNTSTAPTGGGTDASTDAKTDTTDNAVPAGGTDTTVTSTATPTEVETSGNNVEVEVEVGDYTVDILNADEAKLINCSVDLLADEFDDEDVFKDIPTPANKPQANNNANKGPLQPAPRAVVPASAAGAYGPKVDTGGQIETSFVTTLIDFFTK